MATLSINSTWDEIQKYMEGQYASKRKQALADNDAVYKKQSDAVTSLYEGEISEVGQQYDDLERQNAVQKLINEREVAENMANMGLTDSGLNRTQQTAVQLSASNQSAKIARDRQSMVNSLTREMTSKLTDIELNRSNAAQRINQEYDSAINSATQEKYKSNLDYLEKINEQNLKAAQEAAEKENLLYTVRRIKDGDDILNDGSGTIVFVGSDGKEIEVQKGINPYTGYNNATGNGDTAKAYKAYGAFSNGYQPKGIYVDGKAYGKVKSAGKFDASDGRTDVNVWVTKENGTHYWLWNGKKNRYEEVSYNPKTGEIRELD